MPVIELNKMSEYAWCKDYLLLKKLLDDGWVCIIRGWYEYRVGGMPITASNLELSNPSLSIEENFINICEENKVEFLIPDNYEKKDEPC